jgi:hypothetical protein
MTYVLCVGPRVRYNIDNKLDCRYKLYLPVDNREMYVKTQLVLHSIRVARLRDKRCIYFFNSMSNEGLYTV